jgi:hypothetical protein
VGGTLKCWDWRRGCPNLAQIDSCSSLFRWSTFRCSCNVFTIHDRDGGVLSCVSDLVRCWNDRNGRLGKIAAPRRICCACDRLASNVCLRNLRKRELAKRRDCFECLWRNGERLRRKRPRLTNGIQVRLILRVGFELMAIFAPRDEFAQVRKSAKKELQKPKRNTTVRPTTSRNRTKGEVKRYKPDCRKYSFPFQP